jgi:DNA invertase Pin-like site-specific DNA recombinase
MRATSAEKANAIIRMYRDEHKTMKTVAADLGIHRVTVMRVLRKNNITARPRGRHKKESSK